MDTYTPEQLDKLDPVQISHASPRHIQSVLEVLITTAKAPDSVRNERAEIVAMLEGLREKSRNSLFRSALTIAAASVIARGDR